MITNDMLDLLSNESPKGEALIKKRFTVNSERIVNFGSCHDQDRESKMSQVQVMTFYVVVLKILISCGEEFVDVLDETLSFNSKL